MGEHPRKLKLYVAFPHPDERDLVQQYARLMGIPFIEAARELILWALGDNPHLISAMDDKPETSDAVRAWFRLRKHVMRRYR